MSESLTGAAKIAARLALQPLMRMLIEAGLAVGDVSALVEIACIRAARDKCVEDGLSGRRRPNVTQIASLTGLGRAKIAALLRDIDGTPAAPERGQQRADRVLNGWHTDPEFLSVTGEPEALRLRGEQGSFVALVKRYSGEHRAAPILRVLERAGCVKWEDGRLRVLRRTAVAVSWTSDGIAEFGKQMAEYTDMLLHNLRFPASPRLLRRIVNENLNPLELPLLVRQVERQATGLAESVAETVNHPKYTLSSSKRGKKPVRYGIAIYAIQESMPAKVARAACRARKKA